MNKNDFKQKITKRRYSRPLYSSQTTLNTHNTPTKHSVSPSKASTKKEQQIVPDTQQHDKPNNNSANPNTVPTPTHNIYTSTKMRPEQKQYPTTTTNRWLNRLPIHPETKQK
ncbi:hypothetical protein [Corynebacterium jeikeium]|uniref:hypothetical protein n=1 Tax=Corynebacterium jeikeium TaxID=38289 RepID=UPI000053EEF3|nr:hypothetical protein [Corynebacterium jeikeium]